MTGHWVALWVAAALLSGVALHEGAHALAAAVVADRWTLAWREPAVYAEYDGVEGARPYLVAAAPLVAGGVAGVAALVTVGPPRLSPGAVPWLAVTTTLVGGGLDEFRFGS
jgi:hypothetical protein